MPDFARIALHPDVTRDDVDDAMCMRGWLLIQLVPASGEHPAQSIFLTRDRRGVLHYVQDAPLGATYFVVRGPALDALAEEIRQSLRTRSRDELLASATGTDPVEARRALLLLGITTPDPDPEVAGTLTGALADPTREEAARAAIAALPWMSPPGEVGVPAASRGGEG